MRMIPPSLGKGEKRRVKQHSNFWDFLISDSRFFYILWTQKLQCGSCWITNARFFINTECRAWNKIPRSDEVRHADPRGDHSTSAWHGRSCFFLVVAAAAVHVLVVMAGVITYGSDSTNRSTLNMPTARACTHMQHTHTRVQIHVLSDIYLVSKHISHKCVYLCWSEP